MQIKNYFPKTKNNSYKFDVIIGPAVATDVLIFTIKDNKLNVLLIKIASGPYKNKWALPGGLVQINETLDMTAKRVLQEKAGIKGIYLEQLYTFSDLNRDIRGRVISVAYFALVDSDKFNLKTMEKYYSDIRWHSVNSLPSLAFDHRKIVKYGYNRLKGKLEYTNIAYGLLPYEFTLPEMQKVYEIILDQKLDKRNFRKKIKLLNIIEPTGKVKHARTRPAKLYRFKKRQLEFVK